MKLYNITFNNKYILIKYRIFKNRGEITSSFIFRFINKKLDRNNIKKN